MLDPSPWQVHSEHVVVDNPPWLVVRAQQVQTSPTTQIDPFHLLDYPDWINVVAQTADGRFIVNRQYRHGIGRVIDELPSGIIDPGESPAETALRELREETGYRFDACVEVARYSPNPATHTNISYGFVATGGVYDGQPTLEETEEITVRLVERTALDELLRMGAFANAMHQATCYAALAHLDALQKGA